jgi:diacylglycerol kinase (ATP)
LIGDNLAMTQASSEPVKESVNDATRESTREAADAQKSRSGLHRILHAAGYSLQGLRAGWGETAFRQEALASFILLPASFFVGRSWLEVAALIAVVIFVLVTELLNTGIETAIDRIGPEWHDLSKRAKDMGSAAVLLSILLCAGVWLAAIYARFLTA